MSVADFEAEAGALRALYWRLRDARFSQRMTWYRRIRKEKGRLIGLGIAAEPLRLYCLYLADPRREQRYKRFLECFRQQSRQLGFEF